MSAKIPTLTTVLLRDLAPASALPSMLADQGRPAQLIRVGPMLWAHDKLDGLADRIARSRDHPQADLVCAAGLDSWFRFLADGARVRIHDPNDRRLGLRAEAAGALLTRGLAERATMAALDCLAGDHLARVFQMENCCHFRLNHFHICVDTPGHAG